MLGPQQKSFTAKLPSQGKEFKIYTTKQMIQGLPSALTQVNAGTTLENLLKEIRKMIFSLYQSTEIIKKVYDKLIKCL